MQISISNHKSTESAIKNLEVQVGQLAKQLAEKPNGQFVANTEKNPKEECKVIFTKSKVKESLERNKNVEGEGKAVEKDEEDYERQIKETEKRILEEKKKKYQ